MPARSDVPARSEAPARSVAPAGPEETTESEQGAARLVLTSEGPVLVSGPVDLELPDGTSVSSRRPMTAVCTCHLSRRYPFCDASHRTRPAAGTQPAAGTRSPAAGEPKP